MTPGYVHRVAIRYGEVDMQGVVFNAHYLAFIDDGIDRWLRTLDVKFEDLGWDLMVKRADLEWLGSATVGEVLDVAMAVTRWGNTSFVVGVEVTVGARAVLTGELTYVGVTPGTTETIPPPPEIKAKLSERV